MLMYKEMLHWCVLTFCSFFGGSKNWYGVGCGVCLV